VMKWSIAALLAAVCAALLIRGSNSSNRWVRQDLPDARGSVLTLAADAQVFGWTRWSLPTLIVRCDRKSGASVVLSIGLPLEVEPGDTRSVSIQFDNGSSEVRHWIVSASRQILTAPNPEVMELTARLLNAQSLTVAFVPMRAEPVLARFSAKGFGQYWNAIGSNCA
jgi:hypothetical protein